MRRAYHRTPWALVVGMILAGCESSSENAPPPKPPEPTTTMPASVGTTLPAPTALPPGHPPIGPAMQMPSSEQPAAAPSSNLPPNHPSITQTPGNQPPTMGGPTSVPAPPPPQRPLSFTVPESWISELPASRMRVAQYRVAPSGGGEASALVVVSHFPGMRGMTQMNIDRWIGQMVQPDGTPARDHADITAFNVNGMQTTRLSITGTFGGKQEGYQLLAAVIEAPNGPWFVKMTGPQKTVAHSADAFDAFVRSATP
jgi:hypothetical protein